MKIGDLRKVLHAAARVYREAGNEVVAEELKTISGLSGGRESSTVAAFTKLVGNRGPANGSEPSHDIPGKVSGSMRVKELRAILSNVEQLFASAGAKTAVKDLQLFSDMLKPYSDLSVTRACADIDHRLRQMATKPARQPKAGKSPTAVPDENAIQRHLTELRDAGTDEQAFDLAFKKLKASKSIKLPELVEIARQFSLSVTPYKTKAAAHSDIEKAFIQQARFENKLR